jgi:hypothetical protein
MAIVVLLVIAWLIGVDSRIQDAGGIRSDDILGALEYIGVTESVSLIHCAAPGELVLTSITALGLSESSGNPKRVDL